MQPNLRILLLATLSGALLTPALLAQSTPPPATQPSQASPDQTSADQASGVSQPPPDSSIHADEDLPAPAPLPRPSAAVPVAPPPVAAAPAPAVSVQPTPAPPIERPVGSAANSEFAGQVDNTDDGIVTVVPAPGSPAPLQTRQPDSDNGIVSSVPFNPNDLPEGTNIRVRLSQPLSSNDTQPGTSFKAVVAHNVYNGDNLIIPVGSEMRGRVTYVSQGHHIGPHASMRLRPDAIILPDGTAYHLYAEVAETDANGTRTDDEGDILTTTHYKKDAVEYGAGAGTGAIVGGAVAGPVGAGVGTLVGAGAVTTHMLLQDPQALQLPEGSTLIFSLTQPMSITPTRN